MQFQRITSTWLKNCQSRQVVQVLHMSFCTSNSNKICSIMQPLRGVYGIQRNHQSNAVPIAAQIITTSQYCMMKSQGWNYNDCRSSEMYWECLDYFGLMSMLYKCPIHTSDDPQQTGIPFGTAWHCPWKASCHTPGRRTHGFTGGFLQVFP